MSLSLKNKNREKLEGYCELFWDAVTASGVRKIFSHFRPWGKIGAQEDKKSVNWPLTPSVRCWRTPFVMECQSPLRCWRTTYVMTWGRHISAPHASIPMQLVLKWPLCNWESDVCKFKVEQDRNKVGHDSRSKRSPIFGPFCPWGQNYQGQLDFESSEPIDGQY